MVRDLLADSSQVVYGGQLFDAVRFSPGATGVDDIPTPGIRRIQLPRDRRALLAYVRAFQARHGRKAGQLTTAVLLLPLAGCSSLNLVSDDAPLPDPGQGLEGIVIDGYLAGAEVARADGSGEVVLTDDAGQFAGLLGEGPVVASGGTDIATGLPFTGELRAPDGATVVTPLTTLVQARLDDGLETDPAEAAAAVAAEYGLTDVVGNASLLDLDPIATDNLAVYATGAQVVNVLSLTSAAGGNPDSMASALSGQSGLLEDENALNAALQTAEIDAGRADDLASAIVNATAAIADASDREGVARVQYLVQGDWVDAVSAGVPLADLATPEAIAEAAAVAPVSGDTGAGTDGPRVAIEIDAETLTAGETAPLTITFSAVPVGLAAADIAALLTVTGGEVVDLAVDPEDPTRFVGEFVPAENEAGRAEILLPGGSYQDEAGLPGQGASTTIDYDTQSAPLSLDAPADPDLVAQSALTLNGSGPEGSTIEVVLIDSDGGTLATTATVGADGQWAVDDLMLLELARGPVAVTLQVDDAGGTPDAAEFDAAFELRPYAETPVTADLSAAAVQILLQHVPANALVVDAIGMGESELLPLLEARDRVAQFQALELDVGNVVSLLETLVPEGRLDFASARIDATGMDGELLDAVAEAFHAAEATPAAVTGTLELSAERPDAVVDLLVAALDPEADVLANASEMSVEQLQVLVKLIEGGSDVLVGGLLRVQAGLEAEPLQRLLEHLDSSELALRPQGLPAEVIAVVAEALAGEGAPATYQLEGALTFGSELDVGQIMALLTRVVAGVPAEGGTPPAIEVDATGMAPGQLGIVAAFLPDLQGQLPAALTGEIQIDATLSALEIFSLFQVVDAEAASVHVDAQGMTAGQVQQVLEGIADVSSISHLVLDADNASPQAIDALFGADVATDADISANVDGMSAAQLQALAGHLEALHGLQGTLQLTAALEVATLEVWLASAHAAAIDVHVDTANMSGAQLDAIVGGIGTVDVLGIAAGQVVAVDAAALPGTAVSGSGTLALTGTVSADLLADDAVAPRALDLTTATLAGDVSGLALNDTSKLIVTPEQTQQLKPDGIQGTDTADTLVVDVSGEDFGDDNVPVVAVHAALGAGDDEIEFRFGSGPDGRAVALSDGSVLDFGSGDNRLIASEGTVDISAATVTAEADSNLEIQVNSGLRLTADQFRMLIESLTDGGAGDAVVSLSGAGRIEVTGTLSEGQIDLTVFGDNFTAGGLTPPRIEFLDMGADATEGDTPAIVLPEAGSDVRILLDGQPVAGFDLEQIEAEAVTVFTTAQLEQVLDAIAADAAIETVTVASTLTLDDTLDLSVVPDLTLASNATGETFHVEAGAELALTPEQAAGIETAGQGATQIVARASGALPDDLTAQLGTTEVALRVADGVESDARASDLGAFTAIEVAAGTLQVDSGQLDGLAIDGGAGSQLQIGAAEGWLDGDLAGLAVATLNFELSGDLGLMTALSGTVETLVFANPEGEDRIVELGHLDGGVPDLEVATSVTVWLDGSQADGLTASGAGSVAVGGLHGDVTLDLASIETDEVFVDVHAGAVDRLEGDLGSAVVVLSGNGDVRLGPDLDWASAEFVSVDDGGSPRLLLGSELAAGDLGALLAGDPISVPRVIDAQGMSSAQLDAVAGHLAAVDAIENLALDETMPSGDLEAWLGHPGLDLTSLTLQVDGLDAAQRDAVDAALGSRLASAENPGALGAKLQALAAGAAPGSALAELFEQPATILGGVIEDLFHSGQNPGLAAAGLFATDPAEVDPALAGLIELHQALAAAIEAVNGTTADTVANPQALEVEHLKAIEAAYSALPETVTLAGERDEVLQELAQWVAPLNAGEVTASQLEHLESLLANHAFTLSEAVGGIGTADVIQFVRPISTNSVRAASDENVLVRSGDISYGLVRDDGTILTTSQLGHPTSPFRVIEDERLTDLSASELPGFIEQAHFGGSHPDFDILMLTRDGDLISEGGGFVSVPETLASALQTGVSQVVAVGGRVSPSERAMVVLTEDGQVHAWWEDHFRPGDREASMLQQLERLDDVVEILGPEETGIPGVIAIREDGSAVHWSTAMELDPTQIMADAPSGAAIVGANATWNSFLGTDSHPNYFVHRADGTVESVLPITSIHYRGARDITRLDADGDRFTETLPARLTPGINMRDEGTYDFRIPGRQVGDPPQDAFGWTYSAATVGAAGGEEAFWDSFFSNKVFAAGNPVVVGPGYFPRSTDPREFPGDFRTHPTLDDTEFVVSNPRLEGGIVKLVGTGSLHMALTDAGEVVPIGRLDSSDVGYVFDQLGLGSGVVDVIALSGDAATYSRGDFAALKDDGELVVFNGQERLPTRDVHTDAALASGHAEFLPRQFEAYANNSTWSPFVLSTLDADGGVHSFLIPRGRNPELESLDTSALNAALAARGPYREITEVYTNVGVALHESGEVTLWNLWTGEVIDDLASPFEIDRFESHFGSAYADVIAGDDFVALEGRMLLREDGSVVPVPRVARFYSDPTIGRIRSEELEAFAEARDETLGDIGELTGALTASAETEVLEGLNAANHLDAVRPFLDVGLLVLGANPALDYLAELENRLPPEQVDAALNVLAATLLEKRPESGFESMAEAVDTVAPLLADLAAFSSFGEAELAEADAAIAAGDAEALLAVLDESLRGELEVNATALDAYLGLATWQLGARIDVFDAARDLERFLTDWDAFLAQEGAAADAGLFLAERLLEAAPVDGVDSLLGLMDLAEAEMDALQPLLDIGLEQRDLLQSATGSSAVYALLQPGSAVADLLAAESARLAAHDAFVAAGGEGLSGLSEASAQLQVIAQVEDFSAAPGLAGESFTAIDFLSFKLAEGAPDGFDSVAALQTSTSAAIAAVLPVAAAGDTAVAALADLQTADDLQPLLEPDADVRDALDAGDDVLAVHADYVGVSGWGLTSLQAAGDWADLTAAVDAYLAQDGVAGGALAFLAEQTFAAAPQGGWSTFAALRSEAASIAGHVADVAALGHESLADLQDVAAGADLVALLAVAADTQDLLAGAADLFTAHAAFQAEPDQDALPGLDAGAGYAQVLETFEGRWPPQGLEDDSALAFAAAAMLERAPAEGFADFAALTAVVDDVVDALEPLAAAHVTLPSDLADAETAAEVMGVLDGAAATLAPGASMLDEHAAYVASGGEAVALLEDLANLTAALEALEALRAAQDTSEVDGLVGELLLAQDGADLETVADIADRLDAAVDLGQATAALMAAVNGEDSAAVPAGLDGLATALAAIEAPGVMPDDVTEAADTFAGLDEADRAQALSTLVDLAPGAEWVLTDLLQADFIGRAQNAFSDPDAVFVPETFEVENFLGDAVSVTVEDLQEQPDWQVWASQATRDQTVAMIIVSENPPAEDLQVQLRVADLDSGAVLAGRELATEPVSEGAAERMPAQQLIPSLTAGSDVHLGALSQGDSHTTLTITTYSAAPEVSGTLEPVGDDVELVFAPDVAPASLHVLEGWFPGTEANPSYLVANSGSTPGAWPRVFVVTEDSELGNVALPTIHGYDLPDHVFVNVEEVFRSGDDLWMHLEIFDEMVGEFTLHVRMTPDGDRSLLAEEVTVEDYAAERTTVLELDTLLQVGDLTIDVRPGLAGEDYALDQNWAVQVLENGQVLVRAEIAAAEGVLPDHERWLLYDTDRALLAQQDFDGADGALMRSLQGGDDAVYFQQLEGGPDGGGFRQEGDVSVYRLPADEVLAALTAGEDSLAEFEGATEVASYTLDALSADEVTSADAPADALLRVAAYVTDGPAAAAVAVLDSVDDGAPLATYLTRSDDDTVVASQRLPGVLKDVLFDAGLDAAASYLLLDSGEGHVGLRHATQTGDLAVLPAAMLEVLEAEAPLLAGLGLADADALAGLDAVPEGVLAWSISDVAYEAVRVGPGGGPDAPMGDRVMVMDVLYADGSQGAAIVAVTGEPELAAVHFTDDLMLAGAQVAMDAGELTVSLSGLDTTDGLVQQHYEVVLGDAGASVSVTEGPTVDLGPEELDALDLSEFGRIETAFGLQPTGEPGQGLMFRTFDPEAPQQLAWQGVMLVESGDGSTLVPVDGRNTLDMRAAAPLQETGFAAFEGGVDLTEPDVPFDVVFADRDGTLFEAQATPAELLDGLPVDAGDAKVSVIDYVVRSTPEGDRASFLFAVQANSEEDPTTHLVKLEADAAAAEPVLEQTASLALPGRFSEAFEFSPDGLDRVVRELDGNLYLRLSDAQGEALHYVVGPELALLADGVDGRAEFLLARSDYFGLPQDPLAFVREDGLDFSELQGGGLEVWLPYGDFSYTSAQGMPVQQPFDAHAVTEVHGSPGDDLLVAGPTEVSLRGGAGDDRYELEGFGVAEDASFEVLFEATAEANGTGNEIVGFTIGDPAVGGDILGFEGVDDVDLRGETLAQLEDFDAAALDADVGLLAFTVEQEAGVLMDVQAALEEGEVVYVLAEFENQSGEVEIFVVEGGEDERGGPLAPDPLGTFVGLTAADLGDPVLDENLRDFSV